MSKTILITGATDGIGLLTARTLAAQGHRVLIHGRSAAKLDSAVKETGAAGRYLADFSDLAAVARMAGRIAADETRIDVLINNAGVLKTPQPRLPNGQDVRFVVNAYAPWILTRLLLPLIPEDGRIVNLSSAAQAPVDPAAMTGARALSDFDAYAQSKLALTIWSQELARTLPDGPVALAVNPGSLLASKMVREGFGMAGNDLGIGADILRRCALDSEFANASGRYFDNDNGGFAMPHAAASEAAHVRAVMTAIDAATTDYL